MDGLRKISMVTFSTILLLSQVHLSVYAIHCLCTGEVHLSLTAEKECTSDECQNKESDCCSGELSCESDAHASEAKGSCHAPKSAMELGIDLDGALTGSPINELDKIDKGFDLPLYILFQSLKIPAGPHVEDESPGHPPGKNTHFRYSLHSEMLC